MNRRTSATALHLGLGLMLLSCSDAKLQPVQHEEHTVYDDKLALKGSICTKTPSDEFFPVKILFIIDTSDSMHETDPTAQRVRAVQQVIDRYAGNPSVKFGVLAFDAITTNVTDGFTSSPDLGRITARLSQADRLTDYQGALGAAYAMLSKDMIDSSPAERARSKYVVIFFSDGVPDPHCIAGLPANQQPRQVCAVDRMDWPNQFQLPSGVNPNTGNAWTWDDFQGLFPDMAVGKDYNTNDQITSRVREIVGLQEIYNVNEIRFHAGFLFDPNTSPAFIQAFGLDRTQAEALLRGMADAGNGSFNEYDSGQAINFLNINYASTKQIYEMTNFIVRNGSSVPTQIGPAVDSDGDGLSDEVEDKLRICASTHGGATCNLGMGNWRDPLDSDGDGYSDMFEYLFQQSGFDPATPATNTVPCLNRDDTDGDGLRDCEEDFLGTDPRLFDSDLDRISDGLEVRYGMDPTHGNDALFDSDADGARNREEVLAGWDPFAREPVDALPPKIMYDLKYDGETQEGKNCYTFTVSNIKLQTTRAINTANRGLNTVWLTFQEGPRNDPRDFGTARVACVHARYVEPDFKSPADGELEVTEADFFAPNDPAIQCVEPGAKKAAP
ncbi:MAG: VWA domain-containing protein [Myxococcota bacterium]